MTHPYQPSEKPVAWLVFDADGLPQHATVDRRMAQDHINEAIQEHDIDGAHAWVARDVFTASQLAAEVERAVAAENERLAQLCDNMALYTGVDCAEAIRRSGD